jgi:hypothetical protein
VQLVLKVYKVRQVVLVFKVHQAYRGLQVALEFKARQVYRAHPVQLVSLERLV